MNTGHNGADFGADGFIIPGSAGWSLIKSDREGAIRLVDGEEQREEHA